MLPPGWSSGRGCSSQNILGNRGGAASGTRKRKRPRRVDSPAAFERSTSGLLRATSGIRTLDPGFTKAVHYRCAKVAITKDLRPVVASIVSLHTEPSTPRRTVALRKRCSTAELHRRKSQSINHFRPALLNAISTLDTRCDTRYQERRFGTSSPPRTADTATPFAGGRFTMSDAHPTPSAKPSKPDPDFGNAEGAVTDGGLRLA